LTAETACCTGWPAGAPGDGGEAPGGTALPLPPSGRHSRSSKTTTKVEEEQSSGNGGGSGGGIDLITPLAPPSLPRPGLSHPPLGEQREQIAGGRRQEAAGAH
jgi:hypothetical protein